MQDGTPDPSETGDGCDLLDEDLPWRARAACRGCDPAMFFPERGDVKAVARALAICGDCPVTGECLNENLFEDDGIYGGLSGRQRRTIRSRIGQQRPCKQCGEIFRRQHPGQWYCTPECRAESNREPRTGL